MRADDCSRAAVLVGPRRFEVREVAKREPLAGQVRVRLEGCGVGASTIPPFEGRGWFDYPFEPGALGHEGWGLIDAVGPGVETFCVGERVAMLSHHAYATHDIVEQKSLLRLPEALAGQPFPGEPLGCAMNVFARSEIEAGQTVAIVGAGFLGALLCSLVHKSGAQVIAISRREFSLDVARRFGASRTIAMNDHDAVVEQVLELTNGQGCHRVIEATGKQWPLDLASELVRTRGRLIVAGYHQDGPRQVNMQMWNLRGLDVINAHERDHGVCMHGIEAAIEAARAGRLDARPLYTHDFSLDELGEALEMARTRPLGFIKALIRL
ncbi:MAG: zinc-binding dehydrogenase [Bradymonadaceae bacterium]|nr:zinc-binding dehydrogenase [Lujinxingiaceae bacterium]